ncbi:MAG: sodium ion-translocating decarboxylase subunit beta [Opitutales bacterium]
MKTLKVIVDGRSYAVEVEALDSPEAEVASAATPPPSSASSIFIANKLAPELLAPIAVAALQAPIMRVLTSEKERKIWMRSLRSLRVISRNEKLVFSLVVTVLCVLLVTDATALIGILMFGNFLNVCGVTGRLSKAARNEVINVITIFLGASVDISMNGQKFLQLETLKILGLGVVAFGVATAMSVLMSKLMNVFFKDRINPLIGPAGVSAVPMAARVSQVEGQKADPGNFLLMHAMGPNVAGVIGTPVVAGYFIAMLGGH